MPRLLTESDVTSLVSMQDLIDSMESALAEFSARRVRQPLRTVLQVADQSAFFGVMPAYLPGLPALGTKMVTVFASNAEQGLPTHLATITLLDPRTGSLVALMDGRYITEARTAAVSAVSVKHLARPDAGVLAIIGSGVQARSHLEAIARVRPIRDVRVWSRSPERREAFAREMSTSTTATITVADNAETAVSAADVIVLATSSRDAVVRSEWIPDGVHICAVGACRPDQREMDSALIARARVYVDSQEGALAEAGDIVLAIAEGAIDQRAIAGELGEVVAGSVRGRRDPYEVTVFKSLGMAVEDVAAAHLVLERAKVRGVGKAFDL